MKDSVWAGVDIGGTKTAVVIASEPPVLLSRAEFPTLPAKGSAYAIGLIESAIYESLAERRMTIGSLAGIGVSCGGPLDRVAGVIQGPPNLPTWNDVRLKEILEKNSECLATLKTTRTPGLLRSTAMALAAERGTWFS